MTGIEPENTTITVRLDGGEVKAFVDTWMGPKEVPAYTVHDSVQLIHDHDYTQYNFKPRLAII